ncbi:hypothetical protein niasHT_027699 [Heterodera trifolii]|uniref:Uncharacterized protein n=1 Tax=Heterodera trifolii TaxID=157864 RepID=A0ABD2KC14_9BILA
MEKSFGQASVRSRMLAQGRALQERVGREGNQNRILAEKAFCFEFERPSAHSNSDEFGKIWVWRPSSARAKFEIQAEHQLIAAFHRHAPGRRICGPGGD